MYNKAKHKDKKHFYMNRLQCFSSKEILKNHRKVCLEINRKQATKLPEIDSNRKFTKHHKQFNAPFIIYTDFESNLKQVQKT